jgi:hypothetical protein
MCAWVCSLLGDGDGAMLCRGTAPWMHSLSTVAQYSQYVPERGRSPVDCGLLPSVVASMSRCEKLDHLRQAAACMSAAAEEAMMLLR